MFKFQFLKIAVLGILLLIAVITVAINVMLDQKLHYWGAQPAQANVWLAPGNTHILDVKGLRDIVGKVTSLQPIEQSEVVIGYKLQLWVSETSETIEVNLGTKLSEPAYLASSQGELQPLRFGEFINTLGRDVNIAATLVIDPLSKQIVDLRNVVLQVESEVQP